MSKGPALIQLQLVRTTSVPSLRKRKRGPRLTRKAIITAVFTWVRAQVFFKGVGFMAHNNGNRSSMSVVIKEEENIYVKGVIAATWSCTKSFWFLKPADDCYPLGASSEPWGRTKGAKV